MQHHKSVSAADAVAVFLIDCFLVSGTAATCSYLIVLFLRLPVYSWYALLPLCFVLLVILLRRAGGLIVPRSLMQFQVAALLLLCLVSAGINAVTLRQNADDYSYLHRALHAAAHLHEPITLHHTGHDIADLPAISPMHLLSAVEVCTALTAKAFGLPVVAFTQQGLGALALFFLPLAYYRLFRTLRFRTWPALAGCAGALLFLALIGGYWGAYTMTRAWQGKSILISVGLPLLVATTLRCMISPKRRNLLELQAASILGVGLSSSAFFLVPYTSGVLALTVCLMTKKYRRLFPRLIKVSTLLIPLVILMGLALSPLLPQAQNMDVWRASGESIYASVGRIIPTWRQALMYIILIAFALYAAVKRTPQRYFYIYALMATLLLITPVIGWGLMKVTTPPVYWRLAFTSLYPVFAGLPFAYCFGTTSKRLPAAIVCCSLWAYLLLIHRPHTLEKRFLAPLHGEKFANISINVSDAIAAKIPSQGTVIAPQEIAWVLGLRYPELRLIITRSAETVHVFKNYRDTNEANQRIRLTEYLEKGISYGDPMVLLSPYISRIDALVLPGTYPTARVEQLLSPVAAQWSYELLLGKWHFWYRKTPANQSHAEQR